MGLKIRMSFDIAPEWVDEFVQLYTLVEDDENHLSVYGDEVAGALQQFIERALDGGLYAEDQDKLVGYLDGVVKHYRELQGVE